MSNYYTHILYFTNNIVLKIMKNESKTSDFTYDYKCNIITLGDSTVGKTSLLCQYLAQKNPLKQVSTVGIDYFTKDIKIKSMKLVKSLK